MLATGVMSALGFFFWLLSAHIVDVENIGLATALISTTTMISILSLIGFDVSFVRHLFNSKRKNEELSTGIILVSIISIFLSTLFLLCVDNISPQLGFINDRWIYSLLFVLFCLMGSLNILTDAIFLAYRSTKYSLIINSVFSLIKLFLPLVFVAWGAFGIFTASGFGQLIGAVLSIIVIIHKFGYKPAFVIDRETLKNVWKYCTGNYISGVFNILPITLLPIIITNELGAEYAAFFYIIIMIGNLLYVIPQATSKVLFSEGSYDEHSLSLHIKKTIKMTYALLIPAIIFLILLGEKILSFFGTKYAESSMSFFYIIVLTGLVVGIYQVFVSIFRVNKNLTGLITMNFLYMATIIGLSYLLLPLGLLGIGIAWLAGNIVASVAGGIVKLRLTKV